MILETKKLVKRYGEKIAVDHLDIYVKEGEIYGLLGPNGAGKTTAINCMLGLLKYDKGNIKIFNEDMGPNKYNIKEKIGVVPQHVAVFDELTVYENIDFFANLYVKDAKKRKQLVEEAIEFVELDEFRKYRPKKLSGGLLRRLNIACGIVHKPKLIFLDEPTVAVDPQSRNKILEGIKKLNKEGSTIIYTSHYMEEVEEICTRISIMDQGRVIAEGTKEELKNMISTTESLDIEVIGLKEDTLNKIKKVDNIKSVVYEENLMLKVIYNKSSNVIINILSILEEESLQVSKIYNEVPTLNTVFLELTGKQIRDV